MHSDDKTFLEYKANAIRVSSLESTTKAGSGHPTSAMSSAEILSVLYFDQMRYDPEHPDSFEGDDFVISKGHAAPGLYAAQAEAGILPENEPMELRNFDSRLEGHPVPKAPGVRLATGSLGQGLSGGLGLALAMRMDNINRYVYVLLGDGEIAEGNVWEAVELASHYKVDNLIAVIDLNRLAQSDPTMHGWEAQVIFNRFRAHEWHVAMIDGHDVEELAGTIALAREEKRPSAIIAKTVKGKGVDFLENVEGKHGKPVGEDELESALKQVKSKMQGNPQRELKNQIKLSPPPAPSEKEISLTTDYEKGDKVATRDAFGAALVKLGKDDPRVVVLDGDVKNSTRTKKFFTEYPDRSIECFIAEQNMTLIAAGLQARGKKPVAASFAAFLTRAHDQFRMSSYSLADMMLAGSHTGVSIGEDGPSQMGLEDIAMMRALFDSVVLSPCDAVSAEKITAKALTHRGIKYIRTIRGKTPVIYPNEEDFEIGGSKVLLSSAEDKGMILATGYTVHTALEAAGNLAKKGVHAGVIDVYSVKPLDTKTLSEYADTVSFFLTAEDHYPEGGIGETVAAAVGGKVPVKILAVTKLPHSGPSDRLLAEQELDAEGIERHFMKMLEEQG